MYYTRFDRSFVWFHHSSSNISEAVEAREGKFIPPNDSVLVLLSEISFAEILYALSYWPSLPDYLLNMDAYPGPIKS